MVLRCTDGFFVSDGGCEPCVGCSTCLDEDTCLSCGTNETLVGTSCKKMEETMKSCKTPILNGARCASCRNSFYRNGTICTACQVNCHRCAAQGYSLCADSFWLNASSNDVLPSPLTHCTRMTKRGCTLCDDGYFVKDLVCVERKVVTT